ncbi:hypothetical protein DPMN_058328 [Dreissena polymorpha]|uniref:Uncharacterized protein n=1 Tax=Dreissena polymorpha TaxID=45954 RepID=A0A9D4C1J2_DREPO|nr:hypothetical protein DPMN_058328 [Dreissena polymorpha]
MLSAFHTPRRSCVPTLHLIRRRVLSDVPGHSSSSDSSSKGPSSALKSLHLITTEQTSGSLSSEQFLASILRNRSRQRSGRRYSKRPHSQRCRTVSRHRMDKGHRPSSRRRSRTPGLPLVLCRNHRTPFHVCRSLYWPPHTFQPLLQPLVLFCL